MELQKWTKQEARALILELESQILGSDEAEKLDPDAGLRHFFAPGVYGRELTIPEGCVIVGKLHKQQHIACLMAGSVQVFSEDGLVELTAPQTFVSPAGTKRVIVALTEAVWTTFHTNPSDTQDLAVLEEAVIAKGYGELNELDERRDDGRIDCD